MVLHTVNITVLMIILMRHVIYNIFRPYYGHPQSEHKYKIIEVSKLYNIMCHFD